MSVLDYFRYDSFRPGQREALEETATALDLYNKSPNERDKKIVISELPTGLGKSDIAMALAGAAVAGHKLTPSEIDSLFQGEIPVGWDVDDESGVAKLDFKLARIVTSQKILQDQYLKDFDEVGYFYDIRGRQNYDCKSPRSEYETDCSSNSRTCPHAAGRVCTYGLEAFISKHHPIISSNSHFYMTGIRRWPHEAELVVIDEAHNTPEDILGHVDFTLKESLLIDCGFKERHLFNTDLTYDPSGENPALIDPEEFANWLVDLIDPLKAMIEAIMSGKRQQDIFNLETGKKPDLSKEEIKLIESLEDVQTRLQRFIASFSHTRWICEVEFKKNDRIFTARPLDPGYFARGMCFQQGKKIVMQSATIIDFDRFAADMGLRKGDYYRIQKPSPFPISHRPVFNMSTAYMSKAKINENLDILCKEIKRIIDAFPTKKAIIHCHTYSLQKEIAQRVASDRFITHDSYNRTEALQTHITSSRPTILLSPSMTEGVDLKGELARFQIICKIPFPFRGDRRTRMRIEEDRGWELYQTAKTLVQAVGRGARSEDDWCYTFILDKAFDWFVKQAPLPPDFIKQVSGRGVAENVLKRGCK